MASYAGLTISVAMNPPAIVWEKVDELASAQKACLQGLTNVARGTYYDPGTLCPLQTIFWHFKDTFSKFSVKVWLLSFKQQPFTRFFKFYQRL